MREVNEATLLAYADDISKRGPNRVLIAEGMAVNPKLARETYNINPTVIFIRYDGWSLGAPAYLEEAAFNEWKGHWVGMLRKPSTIPIPI